MIGNPHLLSGGGKEYEGGWGRGRRARGRGRGEGSSSKDQVSQTGRMATRGSELCHPAVCTICIYIFEQFPSLKNHSILLLPTHSFRPT